MSDRLALANAIEDAGIEREKAENIASIVVRLVEGGAATTADVQASEARLRAVIVATKTNVGHVEAELKAEIAAVRANLALVEHRLLTRLGGLAVVLSGIIIAVSHYWQPP